MNSRDYWQKRSEDRFLKAEADIAEAQKTLAQSFERARREIQSQIDAFYGRYARNNAVSLSETQKALSLAELRDFKDDLAAFRKLALDSMSTFNLELENLSAQARVARLQALKCRMDAVVERLYISQRELIGGTAVEVYSDQYHRTLFDVDQYTGFHTEFAQINGAAVKRLLDYPFDGLMFSTRLWRQSEDLKPQIQQLVNRMFVTGKPPQDFADELAARFGVKAKEAYRLLYTEGAFVAEQATLDAYREDEIGRYQYTAALDAKTCETCGELDGKEFAVKDAKPGINYPPMHPWCRCTTVPVVEGAGQEGERFARDGDGNAIEVPSGMTYRQWKEKFIAQPQKPLKQVAGSATMSQKGSRDVGAIRSLGFIQTDYLEREFGGLQTSEVVVTNEREMHIQLRHPRDYALFKQYGAVAVARPDLVLRDSKNEGTIFIVQKLESTNLNIVLRLALSVDRPGLKNSVMTFYRVRDKNLEKLMQKHKVLYRRE